MSGTDPYHWPIVHIDRPHYDGFYVQGPLKRADGLLKHGVGPFETNVIAAIWVKENYQALRRIYCLRVRA